MNIFQDSNRISSPISPKSDLTDENKNEEEIKSVLYINVF